MPMREDCRHYVSRTYQSGEIVRKCALDLAPEAPWRCPGECAGFQPRRYDTAWQYGSLGKPPAAPEAEPEGADVAALLDQAEDIVNAVAPDLLAEFDEKDKKQRGLFRKGRKKKRR